MITFKKSRDLRTLPSKIAREMREAVADEMVIGLDLILEAIEDTPVYTGRTIVNYRFSLGSPIEDTRSPVAKPDTPGKTSEMELGSEPRRAANFALVVAEQQDVRRAIKRDPYQPVFMTNNTPYFMEVELGSYKTSEGHARRTPPGGMVRRAEHMLREVLGK